MCKDEGVLIAIDSDAHSTRDLANLRYGVGQARRGWLTRDDVLNTRPLTQLVALLRRPGGGASVPGLPNVRPRAATRAGSATEPSRIRHDR
jgi:hypothetical protein